MRYLILLFPQVLNHEVIRADLFRYYGKIDSQSFRRALNIPGFEFTLYFRLCSLYSKYSLIGAQARWMNTRLTFKYGFQIPRITKIGKGLRISHFGPLVVNYHSVIGDNCYLSHNVTIGQMSNGPREGCPQIGERVWIGPGAIIVGKVVIGDDVLISGNTFVNFDVPSKSLVIGNPGKIFNRENATSGYITNVYSG